jgi:hypothetical protein
MAQLKVGGGCPHVYCRVDPVGVLCGGDLIGDELRGRVS